MNEAKHTPGPWKIKEHYRLIISEASCDRSIVSCLLGGMAYPDGPSLQEAEANAHLIASAPTLYDELARLRTANAALLEAAKKLTANKNDDGSIVNYLDAFVALDTAIALAQEGGDDE